MQSMAQRMVCEVPTCARAASHAVCVQRSQARRERRTFDVCSSRASPRSVGTMDVLFTDIDMRDGARELATDAAADAISWASSPACARPPIELSASSSGAALATQLRACAKFMSSTGSAASWRFGPGVAGVPGGGASSGLSFLGSAVDCRSLLASRFSISAFEAFLPPILGPAWRRRCDALSPVAVSVKGGRHP